MHAAALLSALQGASVAGAATSPGAKSPTTATGAAFGSALTAVLKAGEAVAANGAPAPAGTPVSALTSVPGAAIPTLQSGSEVSVGAVTPSTGASAPLRIESDLFACLPAPVSRINLRLDEAEAPVPALLLGEPVAPPAVASPGGTEHEAVKRAPSGSAAVESSTTSSVDIPPAAAAPQPFGAPAPALVAATAQASPQAASANGGGATETISAPPMATVSGPPAAGARSGAATPLSSEQAAGLTPPAPLQARPVEGVSGTRSRTGQSVRHVGRQPAQVPPMPTQAVSEQAAAPKQDWPASTEPAIQQAASAGAAVPLPGLSPVLSDSEVRVPAATTIGSQALAPATSRQPAAVETPGAPAATPSAPVVSSGAQPTSGAPAVGSQPLAPTTRGQAAAVGTPGVPVATPSDRIVASGEPAKGDAAASMVELAGGGATPAPVVPAYEVEAMSAAAIQPAKTPAGAGATPAASADPSEAVAQHSRGAPGSAQHQIAPGPAADAPPATAATAPASANGLTAGPILAQPQASVAPAPGASATTLLPPEMTAAAVTSVRGERVGQASREPPSTSPTGTEGGKGESLATGPQGAPSQAATPHGAKSEGHQLAPAPHVSSGEPVAVEVAEAAPDPVPTELRSAEAPAPAGGTGQAREAPLPVRGSPETMASLAAEIARKLDGRNSKFEIQLDPLGLGVVNVSIDIGADGKLSAQMAFERPEAAAELRGRGAELQRALEQAGFDLSRGGLSFEHGQGRSGGDPSRGQHARAHAFQQALLAADAADSLPAQPLRLRDRARGLDVRI